MTNQVHAQHPAPSNTELCVNCNTPCAVDAALTIDKQKWCGNCAFERLEKGYRLGEKRLTWPFLILITAPIVFAARLVVRRIAHEGPGHMVSPVTWGIVAAFVAVVSFGFLRLICLRRWWIEPSAKDTSRIENLGQTLCAVSEKLKTVARNSDCYDLREVKGLNFTEIDALICKSRMARQDGESAPRGLTQ